MPQNSHSSRSGLQADVSQFTLAGKAALVTGVSRRRGIGCAVATKFLGVGANMFIHHHGPRDLD